MSAPKGLSVYDTSSLISTDDTCGTGDTPAGLSPYPGPRFTMPNLTPLFCGGLVQSVLERKRWRGIRCLSWATLRVS